MKIAKFPSQAQQPPAEAPAILNTWAREQGYTDPATKAEIAASVRARFDQPILTGERESYPYKVGKYAMQLVHVVDYLVRYSSHAEWCYAGTSDERCVCGLAETLADAKRMQDVAAAEVGMRRL